MNDADIMQTVLIVLLHCCTSSVCQMLTDCHRNMTVIRPIPTKSDACRMQIFIKKWEKNIKYNPIINIRLNV